MKKIRIRNQLITSLIAIILVSTSLNCAYSANSTGAYQITPNMTPSLNQVQTNTANIMAGVPVTFDLTKATIATGTIDFKDIQIMSDLSQNPNLRPQDLNFESYKFICLDEFPRVTYYYNRVTPKVTSPFTCTFPVPGKYFFSMNLWGNVTSWYMYQGQKTHPATSVGYSGIYQISFNINVLPNPNKPTVLNKAPVANANFPTEIDLVPTSLKYSNGEIVHKSRAIQLNASASSDPDGAIVSYRWYIWALVSNKNVPLSYKSTVVKVAISQTSASPTASAVFSELGDYKALLEVTDNKGAKTMIQRTIRVKAFRKNSPSSLFLSINPLYIVPGQSIALSGGVTYGPMATKHEFSYLKPKSTQARCDSVGPKGTVIASSAASSATHKFTAADKGSVDIFLTVTNTSGWTGSVCRRVTIR